MVNKGIFTASWVYTASEGWLYGGFQKYGYPKMDGL